MTAPSRPRFSVVSAVYDVAAYLHEFIESIERQDFDLSRVEVILVDDGSTDDSRAVLDAWASRRPDLVQVLGQPNAGQGAARNAGLAAATGAWVTFPDPDDILDPNYLSTVDAFLVEHPETVLVAANRVIWNEAAGTTTNTHPLNRLFAYDRLADLDVAETSFHGSAPAAFFQTDVLRSNAIEFDVRIRPNFEDGHFTALYLLHCSPRAVGFLQSTRYHYRKRADQSSSLQGSMLDARRYTDVFEFGYLAILDEAERLCGDVPAWLQHFLCYELVGYLSAYDNGQLPVITAGPELDAFHANMAAVLSRLDVERVLDRAEFRTLPHQRLALVHGYAGEGSWHDDTVLVDAFDDAQRLARARYFFTGEPPTERVVNGEVDRGARHAKTRDLTYFGRTLLRERVLWVRFTPDIRIALSGQWARLVFEPVEPATVRALPRMVRRLTGSPSRRDRARVAKVEPTPTTDAGRKARARASRPRARKDFADAWVLMDRIHDAGDSAEILFRTLRADHDDINAWFVIEKGTRDWHRLRKEFGRRVVAHGSMRWRALMAHCTNLLSSHADIPIVEPHQIAEFTEPTWRFTFLQHGVIKDDLSAWLGAKKIDLFVTSTPQEHASIAGDGTRYPFTTKEVQLTGLPRFDRLLEIGQRHGPDERDLLLLTPTWRRWLVDRLEVGSQRRSVGAGVLESDFVVQWLELVNSPELAQACQAHGLTLALLPHPNLQALLHDLRLPDHVRAFSYDDADVQELFARARVLVTDYSSIAFNAAYLDRPVVYFQFDADLVLTGGHVGRQGYFDYHRDGFGPVTVTATEAAQAVVAALGHGAAPAPPYAERIADTFPQRDGKCAERVIEAVLRAGRPDDEPGGDER